ncbi:hypothetical protein [Aggregatilinea lenta]|uniref:hypothetical protein n=1 Tax=Aggregatilinea lenta TaxID=913108 RepID=UPI000E5B8868|nr:hypothetical protein [Aggregatilinea lenta]
MIGRLISQVARDRSAPATIAGLTLAILLAACTAVGGRVVLTATPLPGAAVSPAASIDGPTPVESDTGAYSNVTALLDGVCYDFLSGLAGTTWAWASPDEVAAFYDAVAESEQCVGAVARGTADFDGQVLVGTVGAATGCDAAFRLLDVKDDSAAQVQRYVVELIVTPGCDYELLEPLILAVPAPPAGDTAELGVITP